MDDGVPVIAPGMVGSGVHQYGETRPLPGGDRDHGHTQHLWQSMQVDLHATLFHDIHHIEGHYHRLAQLQELKGKVEIALQGGGVHHVDDNVHLVGEDELPGDLLLHGVAGEGVCTR